MPSFEKTSADPLTTGERVKWHREKLGIRRKALVPYQATFARSGSFDQVAWRPGPDP
jgi:hypothetical protein